MDWTHQVPHNVGAGDGGSLTDGVMALDDSVRFSHHFYNAGVNTEEFPTERFARIPLVLSPTTTSPEKSASHLQDPSIPIPWMPMVHLSRRVVSQCSAVDYQAKPWSEKYQPNPWQSLLIFWMMTR
jgi:hypothetical protein